MLTRPAEIDPGGAVTSGLQCRDCDLAHLPLAPGQRRRRMFPGDRQQLAALRRWLSSLLPAGPARDDVLSVATELGSNAVRHTASGRGGWFAVEISWQDSVLRVAVEDCGGDPSGPRVIDDPAGERGRGLLLVRGLSVRTGVCGDRWGRRVWADCAIGHPGVIPIAAAPAAAAPATAAPAAAAPAAAGPGPDGSTGGGRRAPRTAARIR